MNKLSYSSCCWEKRLERLMSGRALGPLPSVQIGFLEEVDFQELGGRRRGSGLRKGTGPVVGAQRFKKDNRGRRVENVNQREGLTWDEMKIEKGSKTF